MFDYARYAVFIAKYVPKDESHSLSKITKVVFSSENIVNKFVE